MRVVCCGTPYRGDDGAGLVVAERLLQLGIAVSTSTGEATDLLEAMSGTQELLVVDAAITGAPVGTIHEWHDLPTESRHNPFTGHALGVTTGIALARLMGKLPQRFRIFSIEAKTSEVGSQISDEVRRAADELAHRIAGLVLQAGRKISPISNH